MNLSMRTSSMLTKLYEDSATQTDGNLYPTKTLDLTVGAMRSIHLNRKGVFKVASNFKVMIMLIELIIRRDRLFPEFLYPDKSNAIPFSYFPDKGLQDDSLNITSVVKHFDELQALMGNNR